MDGNGQGSLACQNCGSDSVREDRVRSAFWHDERLVVVEDIPALVCSRCGELFYDDATVIGLDLLRSKGFPPGTGQREIAVEVFSYGNGLVPVPPAS